MKHSCGIAFCLRLSHFLATVDSPCYPELSELISNPSLIGSSLGFAWPRWGQPYDQTYKQAYHQAGQYYQQTGQQPQQQQATPDPGRDPNLCSATNVMLTQYS